MRPEDLGCVDEMRAGSGQDQRVWDALMRHELAQDETRGFGMH